MHVKFYIYVDNIDCICLVTQKAASEKIIDLDTKEVVSAMKIIDLNIEVSAEKTMVTFIFEIDDSGIYTTMALIN